MQTTITPHTQEAYCSRNIASEENVSATISKSRDAHLSWKDTSIDERVGICTRWLEILRAAIPEITPELAQQMGRYVTGNSIADHRPIIYTGEIKGVLTRSEYLLSIAKASLSPKTIEETDKVKKQIVRQPVGVVV